MKFSGKRLPAAALVVFGVMLLGCEPAEDEAPDPPEPVDPDLGHD